MALDWKFSCPGEGSIGLGITVTGGWLLRIALFAFGLALLGRQAQPVEGARMLLSHIFGTLPPEQLFVSLEHANVGAENRVDVSAHGVVVRQWLLMMTGAHFAK